MSACSPLHRVSNSSALTKHDTQQRSHLAVHQLLRRTGEQLDRESHRLAHTFRPVVADELKDAQ